MASDTLKIGSITFSGTPPDNLARAIEEERERRQVALPAFDRGRACVKCGSIGARVEYVPNLPPGGVEHLDRTCGECGYSWMEATIDTKASE